MGRRQYLEQQGFTGLVASPGLWIMVGISAEQIDSTMVELSSLTWTCQGSNPSLPSLAQIQTCSLCSRIHPKLSLCPKALCCGSSTDLLPRAKKHRTSLYHTAQLYTTSNSYTTFNSAHPENTLNLIFMSSYLFYRHFAISLLYFPILSTM